MYLNTPKSVTCPRPHSWSRGLGDSRVPGPHICSNPTLLTACHSSNKEQKNCLGLLFIWNKKCIFSIRNINNAKVYLWGNNNYK